MIQRVGHTGTHLMRCGKIRLDPHLGTCLPAPVSEKKVEKLSSATAALSEGRVPSG